MRPTLAALLAAAALTATPLAAQLLGDITFPNSGAPEAQKDFVDGVLYLHNFEYEDAADAFRRAEATDPGFALAYWGEAMTSNHPIWMEQDADAARAALEKLAPTPEARAAKAGSPREAAYLAAVETLYGTTATTAELSKEARDDLYCGAMRSLHEAYPDDDEATTFYALSILGTAHQGRDFATYMRAAATAFEVWERNPRHPGAAHYLIHSFDDPIHAPLGLPMARAYSKIAPAAAHAQHMTSHIFVALGLWQDVVEANVVATRVQNEGLAARGRPPRLCGHYPHWLEYGLLQQGRLAEARQVLEACRASDGEASDPYLRWYRAAMDAAFVVDVEAWDEPLTVTATDLDEGLDYAAFAQGLAAYHRGDGAALTAATGTLHGLDDDKSRILALELEGLAALATDPAGAVATLRQAAADEAALPYAFGPPEIVKPASELLGEVLSGLGRTDEAAAAFRAQLERTPGRAASVRGLAAAAVEAR
jgi:tetratricopeptide (TPR) repeat protein